MIVLTELIQAEFDAELNALRNHIKTVNEIISNRKVFLRGIKMEKLTRTITIVDYLHEEIVERHERIVITNEGTSKILARIGLNLDANSKLIEQLKNRF